MLSTSLRLPNLPYQIPHANLKRSLNKSVASINVSNSGGSNKQTFDCELTTAAPKRNTKSATSKSHSLSTSLNQDRKAYIGTLLIESSHQAKLRAKFNAKENTAYTCETIIDKINDKIRTSYHGLRHLFKTNYDTNRQALSRESFKHIIKILCGYVPQDELNRVLKRFDLDGDKEYITFDEFVLHFYNDNEKVRKEFALTRCHVELIDLSKPTLLQERVTQNHNLENISSTYALALLKAKARAKGFQPNDYMPQECFNTPNLILPHHLEIILSNMNIKLDYNEFKKLWDRFDTVNIGAVKTKIFLKLIHFDTNEINSLDAASHKKLNKKSLVVTSNNIAQQFQLPKKDTIHSSIIYEQVPNSQTTDTKILSKEKLDHTDPLANESQKEDTKVGTRISTSTNTINTISDESIKSYARKFKPKRAHLMPHDDIIEFLIEILNEGYINYQRIFEFIDPDDLGCLLKDEMNIVLREFNVSMKKNELEEFLKRHGLLKNNELVDYRKFLRTFKNLDDNLVTKILSEPKKENDEGERRIVQQIHGNYQLALNYFKNMIPNSDFCPVETLRNLLEQKYSIRMHEHHLSEILRFTHSDVSKNEINWIQFFKKLDEIE